MLFSSDTSDFTKEGADDLNEIERQIRKLYYEYRKEYSIEEVVYMITSAATFIATEDIILHKKEKLKL